MKKSMLPYIILVISGIIILFGIPHISKIPTGCIFHKTTGFYCAGCGLTRSLYALFRGDITKSIHQNILLLTVYPAAGLWLTWRFFKRKFSHNKKTHDKIIITVFIFIVLLFIILRNTPIAYFNFLRPV